MLRHALNRTAARVPRPRVLHRRTLASVTSSIPTPGEKLHGFTVLRSKEVPELELTAVHLQHDRTGAEHLHIARDDTNNVFSIGFKTNPPDDTGVPHILEHTTLCGSEKYPIRDPFFKMLPRTLSNFMNAFTASDHTFYPFATTNAQDYKNLLSVYMDATLHPLLKETDFAQEGWRIGPENPAKPESSEPSETTETQTTETTDKLVFKGVVYNEMKGQMSDAGYLFYIRFQDHIFPAIHNSGGDPQKITDLTYHQLRSFHAQHYHPSNARLFTYGSFPLDAHLQDVDARLGAFDRADLDPDTAAVCRPLALTTSQSVVVPGPTDPLVDAERQFKTSVTWTLGDTAEDVVESFALALVSALLLDGYGSPLYRGLIEGGGLGTDWSPNTGYDSAGRVGLLSVGLTGVRETDVARVKDEVLAILREVRARGFERAKIDGYLHQLELGLKHKTASFGVALLQRLLPKWFAGVDPFATLAWNETIAAFEARLAGGGYLESLMDRYLLGPDCHTLTFTMAPTATYAADLAREEEVRLAAKIAEQEGAETVFAEQEARLLVEQAKTTSEDVGCLPTVYVRDIPRTKEAVVVREQQLSCSEALSVAHQWREAPTNGLTYFRAVQELDSLPADLRPLVPLFSDAVMRLGTRSLTTEQLEDRIKLQTGGLSVGYQAAARPTDPSAASEGLVFTGMALDRNVPAMFALLRTVVLETDFDSPTAVQHVRQLLQASSDGVVNDIASSGHAYARRRAEAGLSAVRPAAALREQVSGLAQVQLITRLAGLEEEGLAEVLTKLKTIQQQVALQLGAPTGRQSSLRTSMTCGLESVGSNEAALAAFLQSLPRASSPGLSEVSETETLTSSPSTFFSLPFQVAYGAVVVPGAAYASKDSAALQILAQLLTHKHLHHEIREKGGAYGGGAYAQPLEGVFGFFSYRDPNPVNSLRVMRGAGSWAVSASAETETGSLTARDLDEAKLSVFQGLDAPRSVNEEGMGLFLYGITEAMRQQRREALLDVTLADVRAAAEKYVVEALAEGAERTVFLGGRVPDEWQQAGWTTETMNVA